jgi:hypothetical protein
MDGIDSVRRRVVWFNAVPMSRLGILRNFVWNISLGDRDIIVVVNSREWIICMAVQYKSKMNS